MLKDAFARPLRDLRISVTDRCNFRCTYCMPSETFGRDYTFLPREEILSFEEIVRLATLAAGLGAAKIRLSGGEPLLREGLEKLVARLSRIEGVEDLAMTTNGSLLARKARALKDAGLRRITVSLDTLHGDVLRKINGRSFGPEDVLAGIEAAEAAGFSPIKINAVVIRGVNEGSVVDLARRFRGTGHIVRFIEFMDVGTVNEWKLEQVVPAREIVARIHEKFPLEPIDANYKGEVARRYRYVDGGGEIGLIASVTRPFCGDCTRLRLSTDGKLYTCLFGTTGTDLKTPMRAGATDEDLLQVITGVWRDRTDRYSEERSSRTTSPARPKVEMYQIGG